jgi:hypothetical protein
MLVLFFVLRATFGGKRVASFEQILLVVGSAAACVAAMVSIFNYCRRPQMPDILTQASAAPTPLRAAGPLQG